MIESTLEKNVKFEESQVGVFYQTNNEVLKLIYKKYSSSFLFSKEFDQYSLLLSDFIVCEEKYMKSNWHTYMPIISLERWKDSNFSFDVIKNIKDKFFQEKVFLSLDFSFLKLLKKCPVNIFSRVEQSGSIHYSLKKEKGIYLSNATLNHIYYHRKNEGEFLRRVKEVFLKEVINKNTKKSLEIILYTLHHIRMNFNLPNKTFNVFGIIKMFSDEINQLELPDLKETLIALKEDYSKRFYLELELIHAAFLAIKNKKDAKFVMAIFFQHLFFQRTELGLINDEVAFSRQVFHSGNEKTTVMEHAFLLYELFKSMDVFPPEVSRLLRHHHGSATGKGFPVVFRSFLTEDDLDLMALNICSQAMMELRPGENIQYLIGVKKKNIIQERLKQRFAKLDFVL